MNATFLLARLGAATLTFTLLACALMLLRRPLRARLGAESQYALWLLVPIGVLLCCWPAQRELVPVLVPVAATAANVAADLAAQPVADAPKPLPLAAWTLLAWLAGTAASVLHLVLRQRAYQSSLGPLQRGVNEAAGAWLSARSDIGPMLVGLPRPRIVLPADFAERYTSQERAAILAHERTHLRRGDLWWNLAAALLRCAFWFHPLAATARRRFLADQELACDSAVLRTARPSPRAYADALLKTEAGATLPLGCSMQADSPLKERILNLQRRSSKRWSRVATLLALAIVAVGGARIAAAASSEVVRVAVPVPVPALATESAAPANTPAPMAEAPAPEPAPAPESAADTAPVAARAAPQDKPAPGPASVPPTPGNGDPLDMQSDGIAIDNKPGAANLPKPGPLDVYSLALDLSIDGSEPQHQEFVVREPLHLADLHDGQGKACEVDLTPSPGPEDNISVAVKIQCDGKVLAGPRLYGKPGQPMTIASGHNERQPDGSDKHVESFRITVKVQKI